MLSHGSDVASLSRVLNGFACDAHHRGSLHTKNT
jgi:hypothetical protein